MSHREDLKQINVYNNTAYITGTRQDAIDYTKKIIASECRKLGFNPDTIDWLQTMVNNKLCIIANPAIPGMGGRRNVEYEFGPDGYFIRESDLARAIYPSLIAYIQFERKQEFPHLDPNPRFQMDDYERTYSEASPARAYWRYNTEYKRDGGVNHVPQHAVYAPWVDTPPDREEIEKLDKIMQEELMRKLYRGISDAPVHKDEYDTWVSLDNRRGER